LKYHLSIRAETPKTVIEGEPFKVTYHIKNIGENIFPGGEIYIRLDFVKLESELHHSIKITSTLKPNEEFKISIEETPLASGYIIFLPPLPLATSSSGDFFIIEGGRVFFYREDGRPIIEGMMFGSVRARSHEEIGQAKEVRYALVALFLIVIFQVVDWILRYYKIL